MEVSEVEKAIDERLELVEQLHELTDQQAIAIEDGSMAELMQLLSRKQNVIQQILDRSISLRSFLAETAFTWSDTNTEQEYRRRHQLCEAMLADLLEREAESEQRLSHRRNEVAKELQEIGRAHNVASRYGQGTVQSSGTTIDFSSDR